MNTSISKLLFQRNQYVLIWHCISNFWIRPFNCSIMSSSLRPHGLQHTRPSCPSPTPRVYSNSCPLSQWCHPTISFSVVPFSSCLQSFPASGCFQIGQLFGRTDVEAETPILWPPVQRTDSFEKTLRLGKIEGGRRRGWQSMRWLDGTPNSMDVSLVSSMSWWWTGKPGFLQLMGSQRVRHNWATELNWGIQ